MQPMSMYSVDTKHGLICAIVPGTPPIALQRLQEDDPAWLAPSVRLHWHYEVDDDNTRVRIRNRMTIWAHDFDSRLAGRRASKRRLELDAKQRLELEVRRLRLQRTSD